MQSFDILDMNTANRVPGLPAARTRYNRKPKITDDISVGGGVLKNGVNVDVPSANKDFLPDLRVQTARQCDMGGELRNFLRYRA